MVPDTTYPRTLLIPALEGVELTNLSTLEELNLMSIDGSSNMPAILEEGKAIRMTAGNPRLIDHALYGGMLALDVGVEVLEESQERMITTSYAISMVDLGGSLLTNVWTNCGFEERDARIQSPTITISKGQPRRGVVCVGLKPRGFGGDNAIWFWDTNAILDPSELGLDTSAAMSVEGVTATFDELQKGVQISEDRQLRWTGNSRLGKIVVQERQWQYLRSLLTIQFILLFP